MTTAPARLADRSEAQGTGAPADRSVATGNPPQDSRMRRYGWLFAAVWLIYLVQPATDVWAQHDLLRRYGGLAVVVAFAAVFIVTFASGRRLYRRGQCFSYPIALGVVSVQAVLVALEALIIGQDALGMLVYVGVMAMFLLPSRSGWAVVAAAAAAVLIAPALVSGWSTWSVAFQIFVSGLAMWGVAQLVQRNAQLTEARSEITRLALVNERSRFARDLHDILGHSLTVVAIKAELAGRLAQLDPDRAAAEIADVERIAREALADIRVAAAGYREVTLLDELASAQTALTAAGIQADLPDDQQVDTVPRARQELFGWTVREGVTNVVRHSGAAHCTIRVTARAVEIRDDGRGAAGAAGPGGDPGRPPGPDERAAAGPARPCSGQGLAGLRERAAGAGATLSVQQPADGGFVLRVWVP